jgi:hypothetical protein
MMFGIHTNWYLCLCFYRIAARAPYQTTYPASTINETIDDES